MTSFVGAEYVIATMLIEKAKKGIPMITIEELNNYGVKIQRTANEQNLDAVFLTSKHQMYNAIYDFSDYFSCEYDSNDNIIAISLDASKDIDDLEYRFMGYIPDIILRLLVQCASVA